MVGRKGGRDEAEEGGGCGSNTDGEERKNAPHTTTERNGIIMFVY